MGRTGFQFQEWLSASLPESLAAAEHKLNYFRDKLSPSSYSSPSVDSTADYIMALGMGLFAVAYSTSAFFTIDPRVYDSWNIFFHADGIRVLSDMTDRFSDQWRTNAHPIFPILTYPAMHFLMALGLSKLLAAATLIAACAGSSAALFYLSLRQLGMPMLPAVVFNFVFLASATFIHWFAYVETYAFAAFTITLTLFVLTRVQSPLWIWVLVSAGTLSVTVTNWGMALAAGFFRLEIRNFAKVAAATFLLVAFVACVQQGLFPKARLFLNPHSHAGDKTYSQIWMEKNGYGTWTPLQNVRSILISSAVAPPPVLETSKTPVGDFTVVSNLNTLILSTSTLGLVAAACWILMLCAGGWGAYRSSRHRAIAIPIVIYLLFQLAMHSVYGEVGFLFVANFFPALALLTAFGFFTPLRNLVMAAAIVFVIFGGINNYVEFGNAARLSSQVAAHLADTGTAICVPTCSAEPIDAR